MPFSWQLILMILNWVGQALLQVSGSITAPKWRVVAIGISVIISEVLKIVAQFRNPDGTKATVAWQSRAWTKLKHG